MYPPLLCWEHGPIGKQGPKNIEHLPARPEHQGLIPYQGSLSRSYFKRQHPICLGFLGHSITSS